MSAVAPLAAPASASAPSTGGKPQPQGAGREISTALDGVPAAASGEDGVDQVGPCTCCMLCICCMLCCSYASCRLALHLAWT